MYKYASEGLGCAHRGPFWLMRRVLIWVAIALVVGFALSSGLWALGWLFHLVGFLVRVALVTAVVALVWRRVTRGRIHRS